MADRGHAVFPFGPIEMVVLQGTSFCNLNCSYCYLSEASRRNKATMPLSRILALFERIFSSRFLGKGLRVTWHAGEPLVLPTDYYRAAMDGILAIRDRLLGPDFDVQFDLQTNGTLVDQDWCDLFIEYAAVFTLGVSCDGPSLLHDRHRRNWSGKPSHAATVGGMDLLVANGIPFDVTAVVSADGLDYPEEFLTFFQPYAPHMREFHFNLHDEFFIEDEHSEELTIYLGKYRNFLRAVLELSSTKDAPLPIRNFSMFYNRLFSDEAHRQTYDPRSMSHPLKTLSLETNGDLTTFYAGLTLDESRELHNLYGDGKGFVIGNLLEQSLEDIVRAPKLERIMADFEISHALCEQSCPYFSLCSGGYNLIKYRRFGSFAATETPECRIHVQATADVLLEHLLEYARGSDSAAENAAASATGSGAGSG